MAVARTPARAGLSKLMWTASPRLTPTRSTGLSLEHLINRVTKASSVKNRHPSRGQLQQITPAALPCVGGELDERVELEASSNGSSDEQAAVDDHELPRTRSRIGNIVVKRPAAAQRRPDRGPRSPEPSLPHPPRPAGRRTRSAG